MIGEFATLADARASISAPMPSSSLRAPPSRRKHQRRRDHEEAPAEPLTAREMDVLALLSEGLPNKAIADALGISDQTVKFHIASISGKLGAANRTDVVRRAVRRGLIAL